MGFGNGGSRARGVSSHLRSTGRSSEHENGTVRGPDSNDRTVTVEYSGAAQHHSDTTADPLLEVEALLGKMTIQDNQPSNKYFRTWKPYLDFSIL